VYISSIFRYTPDLLGMDINDGIQVASTGKYVTLYGSSAGSNSLQARSIDLDGKHVMSASGNWVGDFETITIGSQEKLFLTNAVFGSLQIGTVTADGSVIDLAPITAPIAAPIQQVTIVPNDQHNLLASFTNSRDNFQIYEVEDDWTLSLVQTVSDTRKSYVSDVTQSVSRTIGDAEFLLTLSGTGDGLSVFGFDDQGHAYMIDSLGIPDGLQMSRGADMAVVTIDGDSIVIIAGQASSSVTTLRLNEHGVLFFADHVTDTNDVNIHHASHLDTFTHAGRQFLAVAGSDPGISIFEITPGGRLTLVSNLTDSRLLDVRSWTSLDVVVDGNEAFILATPQSNEDLIQISLDLSAVGIQANATSSELDLTGTNLDDLLIGNDDDNTLSAGSGTDILIDGLGEDTLIGGAGSDTFVFVHDESIDTILNFEVGIDRIDLSQIGLVRNIGRLQITPTSDGAIIDFFGQTLILYSEDGNSIAPSDLTIDHFLLG
jgi:Ca2+-binding RTX toxin-like protein